MTESHRAAPASATTMETVAREAGVSRATVSLVYRGAKGPSRASIEKVLAAGARLGYRHNAIAARLASKRTNTIGLSILDLTNEVFIEIAEGVRDALGGAEPGAAEGAVEAGAPGQKLVLAAARPERGDELAAVESLLSARVDAAIVSGSMLSDAQLASLAASTPFVVVSRLVPGIDSVAADDRLGGSLATQHLIDLGHRRILHLMPPVAPHYSERRAGYRETMRAAGLRPLIQDTGFSLADATETAAAVLRAADRPTAIFADNDIAALGVLTAAAELGIPVPGELSVIGYDNTRAAALPGVALSSVDQQARTLGRIGAEYALEALAAGPGHRPVEPRSTLLAPSLHLRASTAPPSVASSGAGRIRPQ
ncbi:substrate-binding domain-containing protein [Leucobacter sp. gxy201]|uniref:LacI family DNA-binding transcriptional regulator n=1 Tax=Leucobacter sp. gxy201 TaxID=2957200 RepID=UPI003DA0CA56